MKAGLIDYNNKVVNLIVWDWSHPTFVDKNTRLQLVDDWINIGDDINAPQPLPEPDNT